MTSPNDDCYFYFYSTCTKGSECPFRHSEAALGSEIVCQHWKKNQCLKGQQCPFRHMESKIKGQSRAAIPCWFETQPTGCKKPHCVFFHKKPRPTPDQLKEQEGAIMPVAAAEEENKEETAKVTEEEGGQLVVTKKVVEPLAFAINELDEDSDDGHLDQDVSSGQRKVKIDNFGVKTLEQIRMEKVFQETQELMARPVKGQELKSMAARIKEYQQQQQQQQQARRSARVRIKRKSSNGQENVGWNENGQKDLTFSVKTLDQIRQEKKLRLSGPDNDEKPAEGDVSSSLTAEAQDMSQPQDATTQIQETRQFQEPVQQFPSQSGLAPTVGDVGLGGGDHPKLVPATQLKPEDADELDFSNFLDDSMPSTGDAGDGAMQDDDDDELMREIDQVINS